MSDRPWLPRLVSFAFGGLQAIPSAARPVPVPPPPADLPLIDDHEHVELLAPTAAGALPLIDDHEDVLPWTSAASTDPQGVRVIPLRPASSWPIRRGPGDRLSNPFRTFPYRAVHLGRIMYGRDPD